MSYAVLGQGHPRKQEENEKLKSAFNSLVHNFFLHTTPTSISTYNPNNPNHGYILKKTDIDVLMSWAFFGKETHELEAWEEDEKQKMFDFLEREHDITFEPGTSNCLKPCLQSVDPVIPYYKPFFVYLVTMTIKFMCRISLRLLGFQYCETSSGMTYWMRLPSTTKASNTIHDSDNDSPFIFFHGLSPGGYGFYLPFLLRGILRDKPNVPVLLFETPIITCTKSFQIFSEQETVEGVLEAIHKHFDTASNNKTKVTLCGHSFGSVQLTWLVRSIPDRIGQLILMDPISLLLSDGVAMVNFLYKRYCYSNYDTKSMLSTTKPKTTEGTFQDDQRHQTPSQSFTSSEIGIEYYVRRHFSWYNSELWLEDIPNHVKTHVFLSGQDEIINAPHVKREIIIHNEFVDTNQQIKNGPPKIDLTYWPNDGHGYCVLSSERWTEIRERIFNPPIFDNFKKND